MNSGALGLVEVYGYLGAIEAADTALKAANVNLIGCEKIKGGLVTVKIKGDVGAVKAAVEAAEAATTKLNVLISTHVISRPDNSVWSIVEPEKVSNDKFDKDGSPNNIESIINESEISEMLDEVNVKEDEQTLIDILLEENNSVLEAESQVILDNEESINENVVNSEISEENLEIIQEDDLESKTVNELRKLARSLNLDSMTNKQIKFARKDKLIEEIKIFYKGRGN